MTTAFLVMATDNVYARKKPIPLRVFHDGPQAEGWVNDLIDYHLSPPEMPVEDDREIWNGYKARLEEWRRGHPAGTEASHYQHFGIYEVPVGL